MNNISAPVGDIQVKKKSGTYNTYTLQLSMGQITAIHAALTKDHANPLADELLQLFGYYMQKLPGPGEEEEDIKARDEQEALQNGGGEEDGDDGVPIPMPPGEEGDGRTTVAGQGPEDDGTGAHPGLDDGAGDDFTPPDQAPPAGQENDADSHLPAPPRE